MNTVFDNGCMYSNFFDNHSLLFSCMVFTWILPPVYFMFLIIIEQEIFPFFITEYYFGRVLSKHHRINILWFWLSHAKGLPLINKKKQKFSFEHHDSLPKVVMFILSWLILIFLQLVTLIPFYLWLFLLSPYYLSVLVLGIFLFQTKLIAHKTVWNMWCYLLSGRPRRYAKSVAYDTVLLNEAILCETIFQSLPLFLVKAINMMVIPRDLSNAYGTPAISIVISGLGLVRYGILASCFQYTYSRAPLYFKFKVNGKFVRFGLKRIPLDVKANKEIRDSYLEYWIRYHNECKADLLYLDTYKILSRVFFKQHDADNTTLLKKDREPLLLALRERNLREISTLQLATETMHLILKDTTNNTLCKFLKSIDIREPIDLVDITESSVSAICKRMNHYKVKDIVRANLNILILNSTKARDAHYIEDYAASGSKHVTDKFGTRAYRQLLFPLLKTNGTLDLSIGSDDDGLYITELSTESSAFKEGVRAGDRIISVNDKSVKTLEAYSSSIEISNMRSTGDTFRNQVRLMIARENPSYNKADASTDMIYKSFYTASSDWLKRHRRTFLPFGSAKVSVVDIMQMDEKSLLQMFHQIDIDGSGTIEERELQLFLEELHVGGAKTAKTMMELIDIDHDNEITPNEFLRMMKIIQGKADNATPYNANINIHDVIEDSSLPYKISISGDPGIGTTPYTAASSVYATLDINNTVEGSVQHGISASSTGGSEVETNTISAAGGKYAVSQRDETAIDIYESSVETEIKIKPKAT